MIDDWLSTFLRADAPRGVEARDRARRLLRDLGDPQDRVRAVHTGFSGPATAADHQRLRREFEGWIDSLLDEAQGGS